MKRKDMRKTEFIARIEHLEDRRVMSADPLFDPQFDGVEPPPLEQTVQSGGLGEPDFWIDAEDTTTFGDYVDSIEQAMVQAHNLTGWYNVQASYGFTGRGQTVAVIDSGIAYDHFALGGGVGSNYRVVGGWDFTEENDWNMYDEGPSGGHGSHVSGIIGGNSSSAVGVASGVDFVGLRVFNDLGAGYFSWVENALRWVYQNRNAYENPITTINLSLGVSSWNAATIPQWANLEDEFAQLESVGIFIAVSAGNSFSSYGTAGLSYPAASPYVVPVMSADDAGGLSYYSQRLARAIAAPGRNIVSTIPDYKGNKNGITDDYATMSGTSMAAPYVAGGAVIIRQAMEFVGMTNITQDMIYDHMMATADTLYDAATSLSYKRLNLQKAVDALMPTDDYGSTSATAHNLGTLNGTSSIDGAIGKLNDADFFRFTAGSSGNVTFNVTAAQQEMAASWQVYAGNGQTLATQNASAVTFAVTAGQSYTVRLTSSGGIGNYSFTASAAGSSGNGGSGNNNQQPTVTDWGTVDYRQFDDLQINGERWFSVEATRTGILTLLGQYTGSSSTVSIYNSNMQLVAAGVNTGATTRADVQATAGAKFYVKVTGNSSDLDLKVVNLVSQSGQTVSIAGTSGQEVYTFDVANTFNVSVNGVYYAYAGGVANRFQFFAGGGYDSITMTGGANAENAVLGYGTASLTGAAYSVTADQCEFQTIYSGSPTAGDTIRLYDTSGNDSLLMGKGLAKYTLAGGLTSTAYGFANNVGHSSGGFDHVDSYDSFGNDVASIWSNRLLMTGPGFTNDAWNFDSVAAYSGVNGFDRVNFYDSAGDDLFAAWSNRAQMTGTGYVSIANGFDKTSAISSGLGYDRAYLYDSIGNDSVVTTRYAASISGPGFSNDVSGFDEVAIQLVNGGNDTKNLANATDYLFSLYGQANGQASTSQATADVGPRIGRTLRFR